MGNSSSHNNVPPGDGGAAETPAVTGRLGAIPRAQAITEGGRKSRASVKLPPKAVRSSAENWPFIEVRPRNGHLDTDTAEVVVILCRWTHEGVLDLSIDLMTSAQSCLAKLLLFGKVDWAGQRRIAAEMYERSVMAGEILIKEGDTGCWRFCSRSLWQRVNPIDMMLYKLTTLFSETCQDCLNMIGVPPASHLRKA